MYVIALALCASPAIALADDYLCPNPESTYWTGAVNNDWFNSGNWTNQVPICPGPEYSYYALIPLSGTAPTAQINTGGASACAVILGDNANDYGNLSVDGSNGGNLTTCTGTFVGNYGHGKLSITNGAAVTTNGVANIAWGTGSNGSATVDGINNGTHSTWTVDNEFDIGGTTNAAGGTGLLTVTNGGVVTATNAHLYKSGTLTGNSSFSTTNGTNVEGTVTPNWTLTIGGDLTFTTTNATMQCTVSPANLVSVDLQVLGTARLNGRLLVTMTGTFATPADFHLLHASTLLYSFYSVSITYTGCLSPSIVYHYDTGYVDLHVESSCQ